MAKKITLPNGLRIILAPQNGPTATALVLVEAGSEYETKALNGISHFLEHLCFKGTTKRPETGRIAEELDSLGAEYNAFTSQECTGYWAKAEAGNISKLLDIISDLYLNPIFNPQEIEKERGVVIEEINMYEDMPMRKVQDLFLMTAYGDQPAGWDVAGSKENILKMKRRDFISYRAKHYVAPKTAVVISGKFNEKQIVKQLKTLFGDLPKEKRILKPKTKELQKAPQLKLEYKKSDQSHLVLGLRAFDNFDKRKYALQLLANILGGGMSSRLFKRIREEMGAAYYVRAGVDLSVDHGHIDISAGVGLQKTEEVIKVIIQELKRLTLELVGAEELKKGKDHMIGQFVMNLETSDELANFYGIQEIINHNFLEPQETISKFRKITAEEIREVAKDLFEDKRLNLAIIGPYKNKAGFGKILTFKDL